MIHRKIAAALADKLSTLALPTQYENSKFSPVAGQVYIAEKFLPGDTLAVGLAQTDDYGGIYQVTIMAPKDGGKGAALGTAQSVGNAFPRGLRMIREGVQVTILQTSQGPSFDVGDRYAIPVSVRWRAYA